MRIVIAKKLLSAVGGSELQARLLARALVARGHEVTLVGLRPAWRRPGIALTPDGQALHDRRGREAHPRERLGGAIRVHEDGVTYLYVRPRGGLLGAAIDGVLPTSLIDARALRPMFADADVVHGIAREWARPVEASARAAGAAYVETPLVHPGQPFGGASGSDTARYRRADAVIALTEWEASWYRERGATRVHVTGVGPAIDGVPEREPDPATILFIGRKERYKGYHALRAAAPLVWARRPDARFVAIGQRAFLDRTAAPRDERWIEMGVVDEVTKAEAYASATMLVMPSQHETFGHTYLEAWAAGRPVIAGDIAPLHEVVREGVDGLHARNEPRAIADAILRLLEDPALARRMGEAGRQRLRERWTWPLVAERTEQAYAAALRSRDERTRNSDARTPIPTSARGA